MGKAVHKAYHDKFYGRNFAICGALEHYCRELTFINEDVTCKKCFKMVMRVEHMKNKPSGIMANRVIRGIV